MTIDPLIDTPLIFAPASRRVGSRRLGALDEHERRVDEQLTPQLIAAFHVHASTCGPAPGFYGFSREVLIAPSGETPRPIASLVGLVQSYSKNSTGVAKLRQLANLKPSRVAVASRPVPRRARRLTDAEKMTFVEGYKRGEQIAVLAKQLGVHRTTLDTLVARLVLNRVDPNEVPATVRSAVVDGYRAGESLAAIGQRFGFSANKVQRLLVSMGEPIRPRGPKKPAVTIEQVQQMVSQYEQGEAIAAIAASASVSYAQTRMCLIDAGVQMRPRGGAR